MTIANTNKLEGIISILLHNGTPILEWPYDCTFLHESLMQKTCAVTSTNLKSTNAVRIFNTIKDFPMIPQKLQEIGIATYFRQRRLCCASLMPRNHLRTGCPNEKEEGKNYCNSHSIQKECDWDLFEIEEKWFKNNILVEPISAAKKYTYLINYALMQRRKRELFVEYTKRWNVNFSDSDWLVSDLNNTELVFFDGTYPQIRQKVLTQMEVNK